ncbi:MAG TPA: hypothetical protein VMV04_08775 [Thermodesulfobacteriota bacterium]|nr:hypothetical protein [Thermodesulfobacteriota bacterium]
MFSLIVMTVASPLPTAGRHEPSKLPILILPRDGGGMRWGWARYGPPSPFPSPTAGRGLADGDRFHWTSGIPIGTEDNGNSSINGFRG